MLKDLQSLKETEQREFDEKHDHGYFEYEHFKEIQEWLKAHDLRLEKAIREDERERVVEIERDLIARMAHEDYKSCVTCHETIYHIKYTLKGGQ